MDFPNFLSIGPEVWGRSFWEFLDAIVATYPKDHPSVEHRNAVYDMMQSLRHLLPCPVCRKHYQEFLQRNPIDNALLTRKTLVDYYFLLKKDVAGRTGKNLPFKNPDEMWLIIVRKLKLVGPIQTNVPTTIRSSNQPVMKKPFRVPARSQNTTTTTVKKGCGCKK